MSTIRTGATRAFLTAIIALLAATAAHASPFCGGPELFDASGIGGLPFGGEIIGVGTLEGTIVHARLDVTFTATGDYDGSAIAFAFLLPTGSIGVAGAAEGWSGQGTFSASLETDLLNGDLLAPEGTAFYTWLAVISTDPVFGPITGTIDVLRLTVTFADCPAGDLDGDQAVGFSDLLLLIAAWGPCDGQPDGQCAADLDGDGSVGFSDVLALIGNWGDYFCPGCS